MTPIEHFEVPHLALWKSCVAEVLGNNSEAKNTNAHGVDSEHLIMQATDEYCKCMCENKTPEDPGFDSHDEIKVLSYLSYLYHKQAHASIANDQEQLTKLEKQVARYKFGNPLWQQMFVQYYKYYWQYPYHEGAKPVYRSWKDSQYGNGDINYGMIDWKLPNDARIAIVGDIGTGTTVGEAVLKAAIKFKPHAIVHLGDVYYSGTEIEVKKRLVGMIKKVMKEENCCIPFFTVPGNHEYFTGGIALLNALDSDELIYESSQKQRASYFCLRTEDNTWQFLGLDTGFNGHFMNVSKGALDAVKNYLHVGSVNTKEHADPHWPKTHNPYFHKDLSQLEVEDTSEPSTVVTVRPDEHEWHIDKLQNFEGKTILLSHHQLYSALDVCGDPQTVCSDQQPDPTDFKREWINLGLWEQFGPYFGDKIAAWIWGHEHNLGIYQDNYTPSDWPNTDDRKTIYKTLPKGRCAGHSAIPVQDIENPYEQKYQVPLVNEHVELGLSAIGKYNWYNHGFQIMDLQGKNKVTKLSYFEVVGDDETPRPLYIETIN